MTRARCKQMVGTRLASTIHIDGFCGKNDPPLQTMPQDGMRTNSDRIARAPLHHTPSIYIFLLFQRSHCYATPMQLHYPYSDSLLVKPSSMYRPLE